MLNKIKIRFQNLLRKILLRRLKQKLLWQKLLRNWWIKMRLLFNKR